MRRLLSSFIFALLTFSTPAIAGGHPVVVELFSSQGCSACLPADKSFSKLAQQNGVIALALHVNYWDYLGWKDSFATPAFTARQRDYARAAGRSTVYTPQVVVQGVSHAIGNRPMDIKKLIAQYSKMTVKVALLVSRKGNMLHVSLRAKTGNVGRSVVQMVRYVPKQVVAIKTGENAGRRVTYTNIVTKWRKLAVWNGRDPITLSAKISGSESVVILVQSWDYGPILAAYRLR